MKRVKAACILQTLVCRQKEDCGLSRNAILEANRRAFANYQKTLERTRYQIDSCEEQENVSIALHVRKQYHDKADVTEYFA